MFWFFWLIFKTSKVCDDLKDFSSGVATYVAEILDGWKLSKVFQILVTVLLSKHIFSTINQTYFIKLLIACENLQALN